jgi:hypothetical protein
MEDIIFPPGTPDEFQSQVRSMYQRQQMATEDFQHQVASFFDDMGEEQLVTFKHMMHHVFILSSATGDSIAAYWEGVVTGLLHVKYGVCLGCGENHDRLMHDAGLRHTPDDEGPDVSAVAVAAGWPGPLSAEQHKQMADWELDDLREDGTNVLLGFVCVNCGHQYPSIEDRMLREKGKAGCSGCVQKEKWG